MRESEDVERQLVSPRHMSLLRHSFFEPVLEVGLARMRAITSTYRTSHVSGTTNYLGTTNHESGFKEVPE